MSSQTDEKWMSPTQAALAITGMALGVVAFWVAVALFVVWLLP